MNEHRWAVALALILIASGLGCRRERGMNILQEPTASAIRHPSDRALEEIQEARRSLLEAGSSKPSLEALERAETSLRKLTQYYVPLLEAQECAYRAYRFYYVEPARVDLELGRVELLLGEVARQRGREVEVAIQDVEALLAAARTSLQAGDPAAAAELESLARRLSFMLIKGELILM